MMENHFKRNYDISLLRGGNEIGMKKDVGTQSRKSE